MFLTTDFYKIDIKLFGGKKLLLILAFFAIIFQLVLALMNWSYLGTVPKITINSVINFLITYFNLLFVGGATLFLVRWLNKKIEWSANTAVIRLIIDFILFSILTLGWIILVNQVSSYISSGNLLTQSRTIHLIGVGLIVNLFLVPIIELIELMNIQYRSELQAKQLIHENTKFRYEILKNQINPHFLFNSLSILNSLISISPEKAKQYVNSFSIVLRHVLDFKDSNSIELKEEEKFLSNYIFLLKKRFDKAFNVDIEFPKEYSNRYILPMVLQLLVENVVKHNKMSDREPMHVIIRAEEDGVVVSNPIKHKSSISSWGIGLNNIEMRYSSLGYKIKIERENNYFSVSVPYIEVI